MFIFLYIIKYKLAYSTAKMLKNVIRGGKKMFITLWMFPTQLG